PVTPATSVESRCKGVGGWLLPFCLGLTVFNPLISLVSLTASYRDSAPYFSQFPGLLVVTGLDTFLSLGLMVFSLYAGASLWRVQPTLVPINFSVVEASNRVGLDGTKQNNR